MKEIHPLQIKILEKLLYSSHLSYTKLKPDKEIENNLFDYHLNQLIKEGHILKTDKAYKLTNKGKEFANRIDEQNKVITKQSKVSVTVCPCKVVKGEWHFLVHTRLKQPFIGCQGYISGKVRYGEMILDAASREMFEEMNLSGKPELVHILHYNVYDKKTMELNEDKILFMCRVMNPKGKLISNKEGKSEWIKESDLKRIITKPYQSFEVFMKEINYFKNFKGNISFEEVNDYSTNF